VQVLLIDYFVSDAVGHLSVFMMGRPLLRRCRAFNYLKNKTKPKTTSRAKKKKKRGDSARGQQHRILAAAEPAVGAVREHR
jgi:hypothetical protein